MSQFGQGVWITDICASQLSNRLSNIQSIGDIHQTPKNFGVISEMAFAQWRCLAGDIGTH